MRSHAVSSVVWSVSIREAGELSAAAFAFDACHVWCVLLDVVLSLRS